MLAWPIELLNNIIFLYKNTHFALANDRKRLSVQALEADLNSVMLPCNSG